MKVQLLLLGLLALTGAHKSAKHVGQPKQFAPSIENLDMNTILNEELPTINVHVVAHTHDDVGWLKTVDQYYMGSRQNIQDAGVQYIIDGVVEALMQDPAKRFVYVEIAFFTRWYREQSQQTQNNVKQLVAEGRLEFINGGWCMNDEATTHYSAVIDQMTLGHQFLFEEFGVRPTVGWHVDPFGHSASQASLFAQMGFDAFFFGRIDFQEHDFRNRTSELEFVWRGSENFGSETEIWTHVLYTDYCYFHGFNWENGDEPIQDDDRLYDVNVKDRANQFASMVRQRAASNKHNNVLVPFGCDFQFEKAPINFKNMDKLMNYINGHPEYKLNMIYSTPSVYIKYINSNDITWNVKTSDFFPYADGPHAFWTGYFTSRANLKGYEKSVNSLSHAVDKLTSTFVLSGNDLTTTLDTLEPLDDGYGIAQHHDAVAGTEKQHVAFDYAKRLAVGETAGEMIISQILDAVLNNRTDLDVSGENKFGFCRLLNESTCTHTEQFNSPLAVVIYNSLTYRSSSYVTLPVTSTNVAVTDASGKKVESEIQRNQDDSNKYDLTFLVTVPALGHTTYFLSKGGVRGTPGDSRDDTMETDYYRLTFSSSTGKLVSILNKKENLQLDIAQEYMWYNSSKGDKQDGQASGAYIFRPDGLYSVNDGKIDTSITKGKLRSEARQVWNPWLSQVIRIFEGDSNIQIETTITPINITDNLGKEVIVRYTTGMKTESMWYSDSQGLEFIPRTINQRPFWPSFPFNITEPEAFNYVPMNEAAYLREGNNRLSFITDRSRGCASQADGQFEMMLQRRILNDDGRGVGEPLNETITLRTQHLISYQSNDIGSLNQRVIGATQSNRLVLAYQSVDGSVETWSKGKILSKSGLLKDLPQNIQLTNLKTLSDGRVILRFHHIFSFDEHPDYSKPVALDLSTVFADIKLNSITEVILTATDETASVKRMQWKSDKTDPKYQYVPLKGTRLLLRPMEIRTFIVTVSRK